MLKISTVFALALALALALTSSGAVLAQDNSDGGDGQEGGGGGQGDGAGASGPSIDVPLIGEVPVPGFLADLLGLEPEQPESEQPPPAVVFVIAEPIPVGESFRFFGRVAPIERVEVQARISGYLEEVAFTGGETVTEGETLFRIQPEQYEAAVSAAEAALASAEAAELETERQLARQEQLRDSGVVAQANLDDAVASASAARAQTDQARAALEQARLDLSYTEITAAIDGKMSAPLITRGNYVSPNSTPLAELVQLDPVWGVFSLGENRLVEWRRLGLGTAATAPIEQGGEGVQITTPPVPQTENPEPIAPGQPLVPDAGYQLSIVLPDGTRYDADGTFDFIGNTVDPQTGTIEMRVRFPNPDTLLLPNQNVTLQVTEIDPPVYPVVPQAAIQLSREGRAVWVVNDDDTVRQVSVETTEANAPGQVAITTGLEGGERVVTRGALSLQDGQTVAPRTQGQNSGSGGSGEGGAQDGSGGGSGEGGSDPGEGGSGGDASGNGGSGGGEDQGETDDGSDGSDDSASDSGGSE